MTQLDEQGMLLNKALEVFRRTIVRSWAEIRELATSCSAVAPEDFVGNWCQATWEMIVEASVFWGTMDLLEVYGEGAELGGRGSRVSHENSEPTHMILVFSRFGDDIEDCLSQEKVVPSDSVPLRFDQFVSIQEDGWYAPLPPFDRVLAYRLEQPMVFDCDCVLYGLERIDASGS